MPPKKSKRALARPVTAKKVYKDIASVIREHVDAERGMTNKILHSACKSAAPILAQCRLSGHTLLKWEKTTRGGRLLPSKLPHGRPTIGGAKERDILFKGVYCSDELPPRLAASERCFSIIVNLAARKPGRNPFPSVNKSEVPIIPLSGGHFVFLSVSESCIFYVDPFGMPCYHPFVSAFIEKVMKTRKGRSKLKYYFNPNQIQSPFSVACGMYSILFMMALEAGIPIQAFPFFNSSFKRNDKKCVEYINLILKSLC